MPTLISSAAPGFEPIPGYVLREKLGAGGYGEVWLADAPGGLKKAIKFVFGTLDEDRAASELRSLQRIRQVHHPFILSLERIEIVDSQLLIVTELADASLFDRFKEYRDAGNMGIPRDRLLEFLKDSADALDYLCHKHDLQHLDVKPGNFLLVADRVKVADFGLIKDVQRHSMSMLSGLTPTYAAPEMFDGRPGRYSDQYSLGVMYQELLTGSLPFRGRTTAQLASEHLHKAPNLDPLPPADRPILARCLAKKPAQRYSCCREFVDSLIQSHLNRQNGRPTHGEAGESRVRSTSGDVSEFPPTDRATAGMKKRSLEVLPNEGSIESSECGPAKCFFIGVGQTGIETVAELRSRLGQANVNLASRPDFHWLAIDTNSETLEQSVDYDYCGRFEATDAIFLPIREPSYYRSFDSATFAPISRRWLYNIPRERKTQGVRPLAMLALLDHAKSLYQVLERHLSQFAEQYPSLIGTHEEAGADVLRVYLAASIHGATGSSMPIEVAFMLKQLAAAHEIRLSIQLVFTAGETENRDSHELAVANGLACLTEINHYIQTDGLHPPLPGLPETITSPQAPVESVYLVHGGQIGSREDWARAVEEAADFLLVDACTQANLTLDRNRAHAKAAVQVDPDLDWSAWLRTTGSFRLAAFDQQLSPSSLSTLCTLVAAQRWLVRLSSPSGVSNPGSEPRKTDQNRAKQINQIDFLIGDLFREHAWTAQAWAKRCLETLLAPSEGNEDVELSGTVEEAMGVSLNPQIELDLEKLSQNFRVSLALSRLRVQDLMDQAFNEFCGWLRGTWCASRSGWAFLESLLEMAATRFVQHGNSLCSVAQKAREEHDLLLESLHQSNSLGAEDRKRVGSLELQSRTHEVAGRMLIQIGEQIESLADVWRVQSESFCRQLKDWLKPLASALNLRQNPNGTLRDAPSPLPNAWEPIRKATQEALEAHFEGLLREALFSEWGWIEDSHTDDSGPIESACSTKSVGEAINASTPAAHHSASTANDSDVENSLKRASVVTEFKSVGQSAAVDRDLTHHGSADAPSIARNASSNREAIPSQNSETDEREAGSVAFLENFSLQGDHADSLARCIRIAVNATREAIEEFEFDPDSADANKQVFVSAATLQEAMGKAEPHLLHLGGGKRSYLVLPDTEEGREQEEYYQKFLSDETMTLRSASVNSPTILCDGEKLILNDILQGLWMPGEDKWQLAQRVHCRCDIDWRPIA